MTRPKLAVVGAGLAGITLARELGERFEVDIYEKSRGPGGRMSVRRRNDVSFNHGAQFFTARSEPFKRVVSEVVERGVAKKWSPKLINLNPKNKPFKRPWYEPHYIALPGMNQLAKFLADGLSIKSETEIQTIGGESGEWFLQGNNDQRYGPYDWVVSAVPAPQAEALLPNNFSQIELISQAEFSACFALMLDIGEHFSFGFDAAVVVNSSISWLAANEISSGSSLLIHSNNEWAQTHLEQDPKWIEESLLADLELILEKVPKNYSASLHRWRYARCESPIGLPYLFDEQNHIACCGDWCDGGRVEDAFTSGHSLATKLMSL